MKTGIIGAGTLGSWFAKQYTLLGKDVIVTDVNEEQMRLATVNTPATPGSLKQILDDCEEILIATALSEVRTVVQSTPLTNKIVYDVASVKRGVVEDLAIASERSYSLHPMWGGSAKDFHNQNLIMIPTHNSATYNKFFEEQKQKFLCLGCNVHILPTGTEHDKHMAWTLGLYHIGMLALGSTVAQSGRQNHQAFAGTTQRAINIPLEATLSSNPQLYADIQMFNPYTTQVIDAFRCVLNRYQQAIVSGNRGEFAQLMQQAKEFFMALTPEQDYSTTVRRKFQQAADVR